MEGNLSFQELTQCDEDKDEYEDEEDEDEVMLHPVAPGDPGGTFRSLGFQAAKGRSELKNKCLASAPHET